MNETILCQTGFNGAYDSPTQSATFVQSIPGCAPIELDILQIPAEA